MDIQHKIKQFREAKRYSQYDIADMLGISQSAYLQIEKGKTELTVSRLNQIAEILEVSLGELLGIEAPENEDLKKRIQELEKSIQDKDMQIDAIVKSAELLKELSDLTEKDLKRQIENLTWTQHKHEIAFGLAAQEIESTYGVDLIEYENKDPETIQREVWFQPVIEKYRVLLITVISTGLLNQVNRILLKCFLDAMQPLSYGESTLFDRFDRIALLDKGIQAFNAIHHHTVPDPISEQSIPKE